MMVTIVKIKVFLIISILMSICTSCTSPTLVESPPPFLEFIQGPLNKSILNIDNVFFKWKGSNTDYKFKYELTFFDDMGFEEIISSEKSWSDIDEIYLKDLIDGKYHFKVSGLSYNLNGSIDRIFNINAIDGTSIYLINSQENFAVGDTNKLHIWIDEVEDLRAFYLTIRFSNDLLKFINLKEGNINIKNKLDQIIIPLELRDSTWTTSTDSKAFKDSINSIGKFELNSGYYPSSKSAVDQKSVYGSGSILEIDYEIISKGTAKIEIGYSKFINNDGEDITVSLMKNTEFIIN